MNPHEFCATLSSGQPPTGLDFPLQALWWEAKGNWHKAHELCQEAGSKEGDRIHAYLHRVEGDDGNAGYWYARAGEAVFLGTLQEERELLLRRFLP
ncbi:MAG: hypothetical protein SFU85_01405 [Candidatus Methylacidiphilales bacterium]|nr:hypothetical protein [Candidatus Methylacidiphilales bacterium]